MRADRSRSVRQTFEFADGSAQLAPQARETLDEFGAVVNSAELANSRFRIEGHTNTVGAYNKKPVKATGRCRRPLPHP
jgi:outer membrane protein OmpA-like peptidoglycan-associated protein